MYTRLLAVCLAFLFAFAPLTASAQSLAAPVPEIFGANPCALPEPPLVPGGGANNVVIVQNATGGDLAVRSSLQVNHIPGPQVAPLNCAAAFNGHLDPAVTFACTGCQSIAIALQLDIIGPNVPRFGPRNVANSRNLQCYGCKAITIAVQDIVQVDDPSQVPPRHDALLQEVGRVTDELRLAPGMSADQAAQRVLAALNEFNDLLASLDVQRSDAAS